MWWRCADWMSAVLCYVYMYYFAYRYNPYLVTMMILLSCSLLYFIYGGMHGGHKTGSKHYELHHTIFHICAAAVSMLVVLF